MATIPLVAAGKFSVFFGAGLGIRRQIYYTIINLAVIAAIFSVETPPENTN